jgi:hypothetical protein
VSDHEHVWFKATTVFDDETQKTVEVYDCGCGARRKVPSGASVIEVPDCTLVGSEANALIRR